MSVIVIIFSYWQSFPSKMNKALTFLSLCWLPSTQRCLLLLNYRLIKKTILSKHISQAILLTCTTVSMHNLLPEIPPVSIVTLLRGLSTKDIPSPEVNKVAKGKEGYLLQSHF